MSRHLHSVKASCGIAFLCVALCVQLTPGNAAPGSVLNLKAPLSAPPSPEPRAMEVGDMKVASNTGAFEYSYPIAAPPGRLGVQPRLALHYSSQGALRGGVAAGWTLSIPEITLKFPDGRPGYNHAADVAGVFVSSMSGGHRLVKTSETPYSGEHGNFAQAYRAEYDDAYIRYSVAPVESFGFPQPDPEVRAVAMTLDGAVYLFGEKSHMLGATGMREATRWPLTTMLDKFGNRVEYFYDAHFDTLAYGGEVAEFVPAYIEYGRNDATGLGNFARVDLDYTLETPCRPAKLQWGPR